MSSTVLRILTPVLLFLFNTGLTISGWVNPTVAWVCWGLMIPVALLAVFWPRVQAGLARLGIAGESGEEQQSQNALEARMGALEDQATPRSRTEAEELKHDCSLLAEEMYGCANTALKKKSELVRRRKNAQTEEERERIGRELDDPNRQFRGLTRWRYNAFFRDRAVRLLERAAERGWADQLDVELARNDMGQLTQMIAVADKLKEIGDRP